MALGASKTNPCKHDREIAVMRQKQIEHENRIVKLEEVAGDIGRIGDTVEKIFSYLKIAAPSIIAAAVSAGIVNGKIGAFLNALFN